MRLPKIERTAAEWRERLANLREERAEQHTKLRAIVERCETERRDMSSSESEAFERIKTRIDTLTEQVDEADNEWRKAHDSAPGREIPASTRATTATGYRRGQLLAREQRAADAFAALGIGAHDRGGVDGSEELSLGRMIRGKLTGRWDDAERELRVMSEGTDSAGGFLTPETLSTRLVDRIRAKTRVVEAGAQTLPLDSDKTSLPRLVGGVTGNWRAELAAVTEETPSFDRVTFQPKTLATHVRLSYELYEDMIDGAGELIENELIRGLALSVDAAALRGTGTSNQPTGVRNQSGVTIQSLGTNGATPTYANLMTAITTLLTANFNGEDLAALMAPRTSQTFAGINDTTGQPIVPAKPIQDLTWLPTGQLPVNLTQGTSSDTSEIYVGDFSNLVIGFRPWVRIDFQRADQRGGEFGIGLKASSELQMISNMAIVVLATCRVDVQLLHPEAFVVMTGARP